MKSGLYFRLSLNGIRSNHRLYVPWLLMSAGMIMLSYILAALLMSPLLPAIRGYRTMSIILSLGRIVLAIFSLILLFYTNAFLLRRRKREFGLYNVLGMRRADVGRVLALETLITGAGALIAGLALGVLFTKLAELLLCRLMLSGVSYTFYISPASLWQTAVVYAAMFALVLLVGVGRVRLSDPIQLLRGESAGEKPPKANWVFAVLGVLLLGGGYAIAVTITDPLQTLNLFFVAVILVILGTYLLFLAGSVALCRLLQKKRGYYYQTDHFVAVSSMVFRMRRNGAGLASICILCTMVLVMLSSTGCLMLGAEDSLNAQYPFDVSAEMQFFRPEDQSTERLESLRSAVLNVTEGRERNFIAFRQVTTGGTLQPDGSLDLRIGDGPMANLTVIGAADYAAVGGKTAAPGPGECLLWTDRTDWNAGSFTLEGVGSYRVAVRLTEMPRLRENIYIEAGDSFFVVVPELEPFAAAMGAQIQRFETEESAGFIRARYGVLASFDLNAGEEEQVELASRVGRVLGDLVSDVENVGFGYYCKAEIRAEFMGLYGGLFFLGIALSIAFLGAAVLIIYYKQVTEGYEDAGRFGIMRKLGMSARMIRRSVNSQVLTVFFSPLLLAGVHLAFAFPMVRQMLSLFGLNNTGLLLLTNLGCFLVFAVFYVIVYRITANVYLKIVGTDGAENLQAVG